MATQPKDVTFEGLNPDQNARLIGFTREVYAGMGSGRLGVLMWYAGRPYRHSLPSDVAGNELMLSYLVEGFSSERGHVMAEVEYANEKPRYLKITRRVGM